MVAASQRGAPLTGKGKTPRVKAPMKPTFRSRIPDGAKPQLTKQMKETFEKQHYRVVGNHSAVKVCEWTKKMLKGQGSCYKHKFYGIVSMQCMQMTTSISCANRCTFCWRDYKSPISEDWKWDIDDHKDIIEDSIAAHNSLLNGFGGHAKVDPKAYTQSKDVRHVALSLTGEPIAYPRFAELLDEFHKRKVSTFVVTNAQFPEAIEKLKCVTQLYLSVDAADARKLKEVDAPLFKDYWERLNRSLEIVAQKPFRTCIRLTMVKGVNMENFKGYAQLVKKGDVDFVEVKAYMHVGASQQRLPRSAMPSHAETKAAAMELLKDLPDYEYVAEQEESWVILLAKKSFNKKTWINYLEFFKNATLNVP